MKTWLAALACVAFLSGAGLESTEAPATVEIVETPGSPVVIESARVDFRPTTPSGERRPRVAPVITIQALSEMREVVDGFTVRIDSIDPSGRTRGAYSRTLGSVGLDGERFAVQLRNWLVEDGGQLRITVIAARVGNRSWSEGVWTEDVGEIPAGNPCPPDFCAKASSNCTWQSCGSPGCVKSFKCRVGLKVCESECECKTSTVCDLRP